MTSSGMDPSLHFRLEAPRRFPLLMMMPIRRFLSAVDRSALSTWLWNSEPLHRVGDRVQKWPVLVHLLLGSETDACVPGAHVNRIAARAPYCRVLLDPYEAPWHAHELCRGNDTERVCWPRPKAYRGSYLPLVGSYSEPRRRRCFCSGSPGVPSPAADPARLCGQQACPG